MNVLVAEDDRVVSAQICGLLKRRGYSAIPVFDALQALMTAMRTVPDGIILDIGLPGGTGIETLKRLKSSTKTIAIPVIVVSGTIDPADADTVLDIGAERFFPKPIDPDAFCDAVDEIVGGHGS
jgi:DNA-binding response OmpR family regulator